MFVLVISKTRNLIRAILTISEFVFHMDPTAQQPTVNATDTNGTVAPAKVAHLHTEWNTPDVHNSAALARILGSSESQYYYTIVLTCAMTCAVTNPSVTQMLYNFLLWLSHRNRV